MSEGGRSREGKGRRKGGRFSKPEVEGRAETRWIGWINLSEDLEKRRTRNEKVQEGSQCMCIVYSRIRVTRFNRLKE